MVSVLFGLIAVAEIALLGLVIALRRRQPDWTLSLLVLVILALIYDNVVVAIGSTLGEGSLLRSLSLPRYVTHALLVPLLIMVAVGLGRHHGVRFLAGRVVPAAFGALTLLLIAAGAWADIVTLDLEPTRYADTLRYTNAAANGPPVPAVIAILVMIGIGVALLVRARWPWLLAGGVVMFAAAGAGAAVLWLSNLGELVLILTVWLTAARPQPREALIAA
ncbi:hypothetical protein AMIS_18280 [Actinoplanes missouriensis 431]|uniref:Integral membrane protein n=1 Tax=Actinoplanes missouriensis (strain ATCC 14538 / DSM 43046 / CBS 188.64 / JCM 3121 / NBRC 102363 / NCIMB 12654 / NRRL B-3342 / UNCC 431) TaxID=512565 RepID=I0H211_ACTM4|nr:hypothetical protein [Actinoplanes missouriensis]BAL87048.1 hypothetical protein AMIS_18280 [Actinoplanes missouriensis 431]